MGFPSQTIQLLGYPHLWKPPYQLQCREFCMCGLLPETVFESQSRTKHLTWFENWTFTFRFWWLHASRQETCLKSKMELRKRMWLGKCAIQMQPLLSMVCSFILCRKRQWRMLHRFNECLVGIRSSSSSSSSWLIVHCHVWLSKRNVSNKKNESAPVHASVSSSYPVFSSLWFEFQFVVPTANIPTHQGSVRPWNHNPIHDLGILPSMLFHYHSTTSPHGHGKTRTSKTMEASISSVEEDPLVHHQHNVEGAFATQQWMLLFFIKRNVWWSLVLTSKDPALLWNSQRKETDLLLRAAMFFTINEVRNPYVSWWATPAKYHCVYK